MGHLNPAQIICVITGLQTKSFCLVSVGVSILYALSLGELSCVHLPTEAAVEASSQPTPLTQKQVKKELERLSTELQLMRRQRDELRDRLLFITEGTVDNR